MFGLPTVKAIRNLIGRNSPTKVKRRYSIALVGGIWVITKNGKPISVHDIVDLLNDQTR